MDYGIKISQAGTSVKSGQLLFDSTKESTKLFKNNFITLYSTGDVVNPATYTFNHKMGYVPLVIVFYNWNVRDALYLNEAGTGYYSFAVEDGDLTYSIDKNDLIITGYDSVAYVAGDPVQGRRSWSVKFFIFSDKIS